MSRAYKMRWTSQLSDQYRWFSDLRVILHSSGLTSTFFSCSCRGERRGDHALSNFFTSSPCPPLPYTTPQRPNTRKHCETTTQGKRGILHALASNLAQVDVASRRSPVQDEELHARLDARHPPRVPLRVVPRGGASDRGRWHRYRATKYTYTDDASN